MPTSLPARAVAGENRAARLLRLALDLPRLLAAGSERRRQRRALAELDQRLLDDIGLTRRQAEHECRKPPWR